jgi:hypothetical protein
MINKSMAMAPKAVSFTLSEGMRNLLSNKMFRYLSH